MRSASRIECVSGEPSSSANRGVVSRSPSGHASRSSMSWMASHGSPSLALSPMKMVKGQCDSPHWSGLGEGA